jgi:hypothetical protein
MTLRSCGSIVLLALFSASTATAQPPSFTRDDDASFAGARGIVTADFDGNGWLDLAHANTGRNTVTVLLNHTGGSNGFTRAYDVPVGTGPFDIATGDFDRDGVPDLAVANADNNTITVLIGKRGGGIASSSTISAPGNPRGLVIADMNGDGWLDIAYTRYQQRQFVILFMTGASAAGVSYTAATGGPQPQGIIAADFNRDGRVDLAMASVSTTGLTVYYAGPLHSINEPVSPGSYFVSTDAGPLNVLTSGDFNRDGWPDIAAASSDNSRVAIFLGGASGFHFSATYPTGASPRGIATADVNQDGTLDVITANRNGNTVSVLLGRHSAPGTFDSAIDVASDRGSRGVAVGDFNNDGLIDLATGNELASTVTVLTNSISLVQPASAFDRISIPAPGSDAGVSIADFNRNGKPDLLWNDRIVVDGVTTKMLPDGGVYTRTAIGDFNRDGRLDVVLIDLNVDKVEVMKGDGTGGMTVMTELPGLVPSYVQTADFNGDGATDIVIGGFQRPCDDPAACNQISIFMSDGAGGFRLASHREINGALTQVVDVDGDGKLDIVALRMDFDNPSQAIVLYGDGGGGITRQDTIDLAQSEVSLQVIDVNHDGRNDLVGGGIESGHNVIFTMLGRPSGGFDPPTSSPESNVPAFPSFPEYITLGDINEDGNVDLATETLLTGNGDGRFTPAEFDFGFSGSIALVDWNGDGTIDIVKTGYVPIDEEASQLVAYVFLNKRTTTNRPPVADAGPDVTMSYIAIQEHDDFVALRAQPDTHDPDQHSLRIEWRTASGELLGYGPYLVPDMLQPGTHEIHLDVFDGRGGEAHDTMILTISHLKEIALDLYRSDCCGAWQALTNDDEAAFGTRMYHPNAGAPKVVNPLANPVNYFETDFIADPTQEYKLWVRLKAENNNWANDSIFIQFRGATDASGSPAYAIGTTSALAINLEECVNCGVSGWGWRDERWGPDLHAVPVILRFPAGGWQRLRIQTREDGVSVDEVVLSADQFKSTAPGPAKNDTHIVPPNQ